MTEGAALRLARAHASSPRRGGGPEARRGPGNGNRNGNGNGNGNRNGNGNGNRNGNGNGNRNRNRNRNRNGNGNGNGDRDRDRRPATARSEPFHVKHKYNCVFMKSASNLATYRIAPAPPRLH